MRFLCDSCHAQYMISDDKVGPRGVKVRCKKCGYVILVRRAEPAAVAAEPSAPAQDGAPPDAVRAGAPSGAPGILQGVADDEIGAVFDQALTPGYGQPVAGGDVGSAAAALQQEPLEQGSADASSDGVAAAPTMQTAAAAQDWFVAIDEKQVGPLTLENVRDLWNRGELAADSLCWRAGLPDWVPLSEAPELASLLAPRPTKPVIVAPAPMGQTTASPPSPIESAFSAGLTPRGIPLDVAAAAAAPSSAEQSGSWRPSAASALASLMKEEIEVLAKPAPRAVAAAPGAEVAAGGVLTDVVAPQMNGHPGASPALKQARENGAPAAAVAPIAVSEPYPSIFSAPVARGPRRGWIIGLSIAGGILVLALAVVTTMLVLRSGSEPAPARSPRADQAASPGAAPPVAERAAPPAANPSAGSTPPAQSAPPSPAPPKDTTPTVANAEPIGSPRYERGTRRERNRLAHRASNEEITVPRKPERAEVASAAASAPAHNSAEDDFDRVFGGAEKRKSPIPKAESKKPSSVYVPPAPGSGDIPETLGTADIMRVVVDNKPTIKQCVDEQRKRDASLSGKIVMSWTILASGKTTSVSCSSEEFKGSYMAQCLAGLIRGWQFPRHKVQGEQINFPFTF